MYTMQHGREGKGGYLQNTEEYLISAKISALQLVEQHR
jgi:hypothetical protein